MPSGYAAGMEVADVSDVVANGVDDIAFHNLHVIDVVQQFHTRRIHALHHVDTPRRTVGLIVLVVDLAVQQLHAHRDAAIFGYLLDAAQPFDAIGLALFIAHAIAIAAERDHVGNLGLRG
jgi:hypothetical protein